MVPQQQQQLIQSQVAPAPILTASDSKQNIANGVSAAPPRRPSIPNQPSLEKAPPPAAESP